MNTDEQQFKGTGFFENENRTKIGTKRFKIFKTQSLEQNVSNFSDVKLKIKSSSEYFKLKA